MSLFNKFKAQFKDVVQWEDNTDNTLVYKFQRADTALKNGSVLTVHPSQRAIMVSKGIAGSIYEPGSYTLDTDNTMFMTDLKSWDFLFKSPWVFELYFFSSKIFSGLWGSTNAQGIYMNCQEMGDVYFRANGGYSFRITDPVKLITKLSASEDVYSLSEFEKQLNLKVIISGKVEEMFACAQATARQLSAQRTTFAEQLTQHKAYHRRLVKRRSSTVEPVLGTLINHHNMKRINSRGMAQANKHILMAALTYNLKKYLKFTCKTPQIIALKMTFEKGTLCFHQNQQYSH